MVRSTRARLAGAALVIVAGVALAVTGLAYAASAGASAGAPAGVPADPTDPRGTPE